ncbi:MAG: cobalt transporter CbiM [Synechococcales cyanobacterium C42_A2020_086]|jgi:cobalt/nickel transport system permease protein|nr:cobalt transporter CbiM [Synechococcales cyanobacterium M58_A2018_015]MBF2075521.1 cobalt transporter CbiM [Synechococcales cyanobacterium C42_A2020_086]
MHLPDGLLPAPVCIAGFAVTGLTTWYSLKQINRFSNPTESIPKASLLTAAFFVASSIHIPIPPASVHLILNGLMGTLLGYYAFPAVLIGLFLQAVVFGHGGLTTLGVNAAMMGIPALLAYHLFGWSQRATRHWSTNWSLGSSAFLAGAVGLGLAVLVFLTLTLSFLPAGLDANLERAAILGLALAHIPLMLIEGAFTAILVLFLNRVKPQLLKQT